MNPIEDELALKNLMARYCDAVNRVDAEQWISTWTEDGIWNLLGNPVSGKENILALWKQMMGGFEFAIMLPSTSLFEVSGDTATGHWYLHEYSRDPDGNTSTILSRYIDTYVKKDGEWFFKTRDYQFIYNGPADLSGDYTPSKAMSGRMQDKVVIITGGASGIGEGMVKRFCKEGARVILADIDSDNGKRVAEECGARFVAHDVSSETCWQSLAQVIREHDGRLDALLNNAGIVSDRSIEEADLETWNRLLSINLTGVMLGCRTAIELMRENPGGSGGAIVNTASSTSWLAIPDVAYTTSKAGIVGLTKSVAVHCATQGLNIRVNSIHPGATLTNLLRTALDAAPEMEPMFNRMSPMGRMGTVEEVAAMALFLASDEASFCTGGQFPVEGGTVSEHPGMF